MRGMGPKADNIYTVEAGLLHLKQQIENFIRQGKLRLFVGRDHKNEKLKGKVEESSRSPLGEIKVIIGGTSAGQSSKSKKKYLKVV